MLLCDGARAPLMAVIPILHWTGGLTYPILLAVAFALGAFAAPYFAAQKVIVPELLGEDEEQITEAQALFQAATRATLLAGPALAGILIGIVGATSVLLIDAATYLVAVVLVRRLRAAPAAAAAGGRAHEPARGLPLHQAGPPAARLVADLRRRRRGLDGVLRRGARCSC